MNAVRTVVAVRAYATGGGGADYHDQPPGHWIDNRVATPLSKYSEYRDSRRSFGLDLLGTLVVEVEADDGTVGFAITTGGVLGCFIVERHLARFVEGARVTDLERIWDQMFAASIFYGRKGVVLNAISCVDLALWDLLGKLRETPVYELLGGAVRDEQPFYATGSRPDLAAQLGFIGGKMPLKHAPHEGETGLQAAVDELSTMRERVGADFWLMYDCWMSLDIAYAVELAMRCRDLKLRWIEEPFPPDDYWAYSALRERIDPRLLVSAGEHEATRWGFRLLIELGKCDILQPDVGWCGGLTELLRISAAADTAGKMVVPHGSSVYSYHFVISRHNSPFAEFLMMAPGADRIVPMFHPLLLDEPVPLDGTLSRSALDRPGFGVRLNPDVDLVRAYPR